MLPLRFWRPGQTLAPDVLMLAFFPSVPPGGVRHWLSLQWPGWVLQPGPPPWRLCHADGRWAGVSFSYVDGAAVVAMAFGREVGVDLVAPLPPPDAAAVAQLYLGTVEAAMLVGTEAHVFAQRWAAYEARQKCHGLGVQELAPGAAGYATAATCCTDAIWLAEERYLCCIAYR